MRALLWNGRPALDYTGDPARPRNNYLPRGGKYWTVARQAWAVKHGFFVQIDWPTQRPIFHSLVERGVNAVAQFKLPDWHVISYADPRATMRTIARHAKAGDRGWLYLARFIMQQDMHGYFGAWDGKVEVCTRTLAWYKNYVIDSKPKPSFLDERHIERMNAMKARGAEIARLARAKKHDRAALSSSKSVEGTARSKRDQHIIDARMAMTDQQLDNLRLLGKLELTSVELAAEARRSNKPWMTTTLAIATFPKSSAAWRAQGAAKRKRSSKRVELDERCAALVRERKQRLGW